MLIEQPNKKLSFDEMVEAKDIVQNLGPHQLKLYTLFNSPKYQFYEGPYPLQRLLKEYPTNIDAKRALQNIGIIPRSKTKSKHKPIKRYKHKNK